MSAKLPRAAQDNLIKCREAAIAAVDSYNRPGPRFRTAQFIILINVAWVAYFHASFYKRRKNPWYRTRTSGTGRGVRYQKVDNEPKHWDLRECVRRYFGSRQSPVRANLEFLIGLRNKIEHRHLPELDAMLYGECQAALLNLEAHLCEDFGPKFALAEQLAVSLQFTKLVPAEKRRAARLLAADAASGVKDYIEKFRGALASSVLNSTGYSFSVYLVPKVANRESASAAAVEFVHVDSASSDELERMTRLNVLIREKHIAISNLDMLKPTEVARRVEKEIPFKFSVASHTEAWRHFRVRPGQGSRRPEKTQQEYCVYDRAHDDYLYTEAWVRRLVRELATDGGYEGVVGRAPTAK